MEIIDLDDNLPEFLQEDGVEFFVEVKEGLVGVHKSYEMPAAIDRDTKRNRNTYYKIEYNKPETSQTSCKSYWSVV